MAQVKLLKLDATTGLPNEFDSSADDITLNSYTVQGGGPVLSGSGLDMNNQDIADVNDLAFNNPATGTINATAGNIIIDNLMAKERDNSMTASSGILFPLVTDVAGEVDAFKIPHIAGVPSATPSFSSAAGYMVYDDTNNNLYIWDGSAWDNLNSVAVANNLDQSFTAGENLTAADVVYISAANTVSKAKGDADATRDAIGIATASVSAAASVDVRMHGVATGFTGLTPGARYYLSAATAGAVTATPPNSSGKSLVNIGFSKSATSMALQIHFIGKRA